MMRKLILISMVLLLAEGAMAAGKYVQYGIGAESFEGYYISPADKAPLILIVHDWDGLTDYEVKRANMLAELGYAVFALDLFGEGVRPVETAEKKKLTGMLYDNRDRMRTLLEGGLGQAAELGGNQDNAVVIGYCFGGAAVLELARSGVALKGFVTFHGGLETPSGQDYAKTNGSILVFHGSADQSVSLDQFASLAKELEKQNIKHEMVTYSGAPHAFTVFESERYRKDADEKSWQRFVGFLGETLH
jgi:dienelactone hydrolase